MVVQWYLVHATFASNQGSIGRYLRYGDIYIHKHTQSASIVLKSMSNIFIGAELGGAAGARAPPLLHNPRNLIV